jgi:hypothetical protein
MIRIRKSSQAEAIRLYSVGPQGVKMEILARDVTTKPTIGPPGSTADAKAEHDAAKTSRTSQPIQFTLRSRFERKFRHGVFCATHHLLAAARCHPR